MNREKIILKTYALKNPIIAVVFFLVFCQWARAQGTGTRIDITDRIGLSSSAGQFAQIFIPDYFSPSDDDRFILVFHLHSASWAAEDQVYKAQANAILCNIHIGALSSPYQNYFQNSLRFAAILEIIKEELDSQNVIKQGQIDKLIITSFSAGYAAVREILKSASYYGMIDAIILADGLHASSDAASMQIQMADFLRYARDARDKKKIMFLTHSSIPTPGYKSTTETANYLISGINGQREPIAKNDPVGFQTSACDTGNFHLKGYTGTTADDHMKHLYNMHLMLEPAIDLISQPVNAIAKEDLLQNSEILPDNYPNPFNNSTVIRFHLPERTRVRLKIFNQLGQQVELLEDRVRSQGEHNITWNTGNLPSGVYYYSLSFMNKQITRRCLLVK